MTPDKHNKLIVIAINTSWNVFNFRMSLIRALMEKGHRVGVVAPVDDFSAQLQALGCEFYPIRINNKGTNPFTELMSVYRYYRTYKNLRPAVILHYTPKPNIYGALAARMLRIPCINNIAGLGTAFIESGVLSFVVKNLYRVSQGSAARVFFQNRDDMDEFVAAKIVRDNQVDLLPGSGIELDIYSPVPKTPSETVSFVLIARLIVEKGVGDFAKAARILKRNYPNAHFRLVGFVDRNNPGAVTEEQIRAWEQEQILEWMGRQDDVRPFIADADCVVLPSYYREGTPRTLLEAAAMAKPLIAADSVGTREPVDDGVNGFLCRPRDPEDLAEKMIKIIEMGHESRLEMGRRGRGKMVKEYDVNIVIRKYCETIQWVIAERT